MGQSRLLLCYILGYMLAWMCAKYPRTLTSSGLCSSTGAIRDTHILLPMEFSGVYGFPSVRGGNLFTSMILFLNVHHRRAAQGWGLGSSKINLLPSENRETLLVGVSFRVVGRCEENSSARYPSSDKPRGLAVCKGGCPLVWRIYIKPNSYFCR